jgi:hypothetical protein
LNLLSPEKTQEHKHRGNYRAEKCHDGHQPDHLLARTQTDDSAEATARGDFPSLVDILEREPEVGRGHCRISYESTENTCFPNPENPVQVAR